MTAAAVVHIGPQSPGQVGYDLTWETRTEHYDVWLHDAAVEVRAAALAAEQRVRTGGAE